MCEVDNLMYTIGLQERVRARVETDGRVYLEDTDTEVLNRMKLCYGTVVVVAVFGGVVGGAFLQEGMQVGEDFIEKSSFWSFFLGYIVEAAIQPGETTKERLRGVAGAVGRYIAGYLLRIISYVQ